MLVIRSMTVDDVPLLANIVSRNYNRHCAEAFHHEARCAFYHYPFPPRFIVAEDADKGVIGCACWNTDWVSWGIFNLSWVQVHPEHQGAGIGTALVNAALDELRPQASLVMLATTKPKYYERWGFEALRTYSATVEYETAGEVETLMALALRPPNQAGEA